MLSDLVKNSATTLLISEIVCQEIQNLYAEGLSEAVSQSKKSYKNLGRFFQQKSEFAEPTNSYDFKTILQSTFEFIEFVGFSNVPHQIVVERAIREKLPFRQNEKGYRDTLIWLSLLENLSKKSEGDEIIFISKNTNDF
ncbi:MAG TPA: PIN domain-containing protein, partial [Flavisolibacter sp.]|nr:PIN domain-containing protein [Flavisolibacter sp.]